MIGTDDQWTFFSPGFAHWQVLAQASLTLRQFGNSRVWLATLAVMVYQQIVSDSLDRLSMVVQVGFVRHLPIEQRYNRPTL